MKAVSEGRSPPELVHAAQCRSELSCQARAGPNRLKALLPDEAERLTKMPFAIIQAPPGVLPCW